MAFCNKCGAELPENSKFCTSCGAKAENNVAAEAPVFETPVEEAPKATETYSMPTQTAPVQKEKKPVNKKLFIIIGAAALALILMIVVIVVISNIVKTNKEIKAKTITLNEEYFEVYFYGYETFDVSIDIEFTEEFEEDALKALGYAKNTTKKKAHRELSDLKYAIDFEYEDIDKLSNGDELTIKAYLIEDYESDEKLDFVTVKEDKKDKKKADVIIKEIEFTVEVEGLKDVVVYNPFDDLEVTTHGTDGDVYVDWNYTGDEYIDYYDFDCDNEYDLSIGDEFTITMEDYAIEYLLESYGLLIEETSKTYKVETADRYLESAKDISDDTLSELMTDSEEEIYDEYDWSFMDFDVSELEYKGMYFLNLTDDDSWSYENSVILVYTGELSNEGYDPFEAYFAVKFSGIFESAEGEQTVDTYGSMIYETVYMEDSWDSYDGFATEKDLYDYVVEYYSDEYEISLNGDLTDYSNYEEPDVEEDAEEETEEGAEEETEENTEDDSEESETTEEAEEETTEEI